MEWLAESSHPTFADADKARQEHKYGPGACAIDYWDGKDWRYDLEGPVEV
jgi:hypothetical protein